MEQKIRIAVWHEGDERNPHDVFQVHVTRSAEGEISAGLSSPRAPYGPVDPQPFIAAIRQWLVSINASNGTAPPMEVLSKALQDHLRSQGFRTDSLPDDDIGIELSIDMRSGRAVARQSALHPYVGRLSGIEDRVRTAMLSLLSTKADDARLRVRKALDVGDHEAAARETIAADIAGSFDTATPVLDLRTTLGAVSIGRLPAGLREPFLIARMKVAERERDLLAAADDADTLLQESPTTSGAVERRTLIAVSALGDAVRGAKAAAHARLTELLRDGNAPVEFRAWTCRNMALTLGARDPLGLDLARMSYDAFVEAGQLLEAVRSVALYVQKSTASQPRSALAILDEAGALLAGAGSDLAMRDLRAAVMILRAEVEIEHGQPHLALAHAQDAATQWRGTLGAEKELLRALGLARAAATEVGDKDLAQTLTSEIRQLMQQSPSELEMTLRERALALLQRFDPAEAAAIKAEAEKNHDNGLRALVMVAEVTVGEMVGAADRLRHLEKARALLSGDADTDDRLIVDAALAGELLTNENYESALRAYQDLLRRSPQDRESRQNVAALLMKLRRWPEAVRFFQEQVERHGILPGLLYGLGRSQFECGLYSDAATNLHRAISIPGSDNIREPAQRLIDLALEHGGKLAPPMAAPPPPFVDRKEWRAVLDEFAAFIGQSKRQSFWKGSKGKAKWREHPERFAQDLFVTFVRGRLGDRVEVFEELPNVGAGRLDVLVLLPGGLRVIVELKMLGGGSYSESYAFSGEEQIGHYMANKKTALGYLLIFDARVDAWASGIAPLSHILGGVVETIFVDVRRMARRSAGSRPVSA